ncbi:MAG TPA: histidine kinase [Kofleriaceae bacterium]|nr:histidine kinase [Kofleriaceae bacterium]
MRVLLRWLVANAALGVAVGALLAVAQGATDPASFARAVLVSTAFSMAIGTGVRAAIAAAQRRLAGRSALAHWVVILALVALVTVVACVAVVGAFTLIGWYPRGQFWPIVAFALRISTVVGVIATASGFAFDRMARRLEAAQLAEARARELAAEARLSALEARVQPHFLFNTLNSILSLIPEEPARAGELLEHLSSLLRFALDAGRRGLVPLADEARIVRGYLAIESARLGDRLRATVDLPDELAPWPVPPFALQTLVENSVRHSIAARRGGGELRVRARRAGELLEITVWDDGGGFTREELQPGHGIDNLEGRLAALYQGRGRLELARGDGMTVTVAVPA